ncbi:hypothetical protein FRC10_006846 [Ceratobasidium sp. 414]|nr:hypothetical protein FRC10_006846 [Ceratobasidium sp. 414]
MHPFLDSIQSAHVHNESTKMAFLPEQQPAGPTQPAPNHAVAVAIHESLPNAGQGPLLSYNDEQALLNMFDDYGQPLTPTGAALAGTFDQISNAIDAPNAGSVPTSSDIHTHHNMAFPNTHMSGHSYAHMSSNAGSALPQPGGPAYNAFTSSLSVHLSNDPLIISPEKRNADLSGTRFRFTWKNWEKNDVIRFFAGPGVPGHFTTIAMDSRQSPRKTSTLAVECDNLSTTWFCGQRSPITLVHQWWELHDVYCRILASFHASPGEPAANIIERIHQSFSGPHVPTGLLIKIEDVAAWVDGDLHGWFAMIHERVQHHPETTKTLANLRADGGEANTSAVARPRRSKSTKSASKSASSKAQSVRYADTPPAPRSAAGSALQPQQSQLSQSSSAQEDIPDVPEHAVPAHAPGMVEMVRNHSVISDARIELAKAKAEYLRSAADATRLKIAERAITMVQHDRKLQRTTALEILGSTSSPQSLKDKSVVLLDAFLFLDLPPITTDELEKALRRCIPVVRNYVGDNLANTLTQIPDDDLIHNLEDLPPAPDRDWLVHCVSQALYITLLMSCRSCLLVPYGLRRD